MCARMEQNKFGIQIKFSSINIHDVNQNKTEKKSAA